MKNLIFASLLLAMSSCSQQEPYKAEWRDLARHNTPEWLMDSKFGVYCHWGPQTVLEDYRGKETPTYSEAYDLWHGEKFDAAEWAELFKGAGAHFAGVIGQHMTGCLNWDSDVTSWNSTNYGPKVDIVGELTREYRKRDMKTFVSIHSITTEGIWGERSNSDRTFAEPFDEFSDDGFDRNDTRWVEGWRDRIYELTDRYDTDMLWFDTSFGASMAGKLRGYIKDGKFMPESSTTAPKLGGAPESLQQDVIANYFNTAQRRGKEVEVVFKANDMPYNVGMRDIENGNLDGMQYDPWMTDINMLKLHPDYWSNWFYDAGCELKDANFIVDMIIDVASKNGRLLLSLPPKADGSFAQNVIDELHRIGEWMAVNDEGLYGSNPWAIYGEGPTYIKHPGDHGQTHARGREMAEFCADDIRYTTKDGNIYAFVLGLPESRESYMQSLGSEYKLYPNEIKRIELLGYDGEIKWSHEAKGLRVEFPQNVKADLAYCFKIIR